MNEHAIEHELLRQAMCVLDGCTIETETEHFQENTRVRITMAADEELFESCAFGVIFALGALSFHHARPRGHSDIEFQEQDAWTAGDMLRCLTFVGGRLCFYADYVRGRMMKTQIDISSDGRIVLVTQNRGEAAARWVQQLQGKLVLTLVEPETTGEENE